MELKEVIVENNNIPINLSLDKPKHSLELSINEQNYSSKIYFTKEQVKILNDTFHQNKYLTTEERIKLAQDAGLDEKKVQRWFDSRRRKEKSKNSPSDSIQPATQNKQFTCCLKVKRSRTNFSKEQVKIFEEAFRCSKFVTQMQSQELANHVGVSEHNVKIWFQNRRQKEKLYSAQVSNSLPNQLRKGKKTVRVVSYNENKVNPRFTKSISGNNREKYNGMWSHQLDSAPVALQDQQYPEIPKPQNFSCNNLEKVSEPFGILHSKDLVKSFDDTFDYEKRSAKEERQNLVKDVEFKENKLSNVQIFDNYSQKEELQNSNQMSRSSSNQPDPVLQFLKKLKIYQAVNAECMTSSKSVEQTIQPFQKVLMEEQEKKLKVAYSFSKCLTKEKIRSTAEDVGIDQKMVLKWFAKYQYKNQLDQSVSSLTDTQPLNQSNSTRYLVNSKKQMLTFTEEKLKKLEEEFYQAKYQTKEGYEKLVTELGIDKEKIKRWFSRRRRKEKLKNASPCVNDLASNSPQSYCLEGAVLDEQRCLVDQPYNQLTESRTMVPLNHNYNSLQQPYNYLQLIPYWGQENFFYQNLHEHFEWPAHQLLIPNYNWPSEHQQHPPEIDSIINEQPLNFTLPKK